MSPNKTKSQQQTERYRKVLSPNKHGKPDTPVLAGVARSSKRRVQVVFA